MNTKGTAWIGLMNYLNKSFSAAEINKLKAILDDEAKALFEKKILHTSWIDYATYIKTLVIADRVLGRGNLDLMRQVNYYQARNEVRGPYKILISLLSPKTVINSGCKMYRQYYDKGQLTVVNLTLHNVTFKIEDAPDIPRYHDVELEAYFEELMRIAGAKNIKWTNHKCIAKGDPFCLDEVTWE